MKLLFLGFILCATPWIISGHPKAEEVYKWKRVVYENLPHSEQSYVGPYPYYIAENNDITSIGYHPASGLFLVVIVRLRPGVPTSLGAFCVDGQKRGSSPKIWGFPNYEANALLPSDFAGGSVEENQGRRLERSRKIEEGKRNSTEDEGRKNKPNNHLSNYGHHSTIHVPFYKEPTAVAEKSSGNGRIISVCYVTIDERCNRAFFLDRGMIRYYRNSTYNIQNPSLVVIDLPGNGCQSRNFPISRQAVIPDRIASKGSNGFMVSTLDYQSENSCDDLFVYIPNAFFNYLVVYDFKKDQFWAFEHETFNPVSSEAPLVFEKTFDYEFDLGIISVALGYPDENGDRTAYYTNIAGTAQYAVSTKVLKNRRKSPENYGPDDFRIMGYRGSGHQSLRTVIDYTYGVMFYGEAQSYQIRCWNINKPLNPDNIGVVFESEKLSFGIYVAIDSGGYLWFHTCHLPIDYIVDTPLNLQEVNSRSWRIKVSDAIKGTVCEN